MIFSFCMTERTLKNVWILKCKFKIAQKASLQILLCSNLSYITDIYC